MIGKIAKIFFNRLFILAREGVFMGLFRLAREYGRTREGVEIGAVMRAVSVSGHHHV